MTFKIIRQSYHVMFGLPVGETLESPIFSAEPVVGKVEDSVEDAARLERASGALSALEPDSLPLAARSRRHPAFFEMHPTVVLDQIPLSDKKRAHTSPHAQTHFFD